MEISKLIGRNGEVLAANYHMDDGTVVRWKPEKKSGLNMPTGCGRCLAVNNATEGAEVERALTHMLGEFGERIVVSFLCDLDKKNIRLIDVLAAMKGPNIRILEAPRMAWPKANESRREDEAGKGGGGVRVLETPTIDWSKEEKK